MQEYYGRALERELSRGPSHKSCPDYRCCATIAAIMIFIIEAARRRRRHSANTHNARASGREEEAHSLIHIPFFVYILLSFHALLCGPGDYVTLRPKWSAKNDLCKRKSWAHMQWIICRQPQWSRPRKERRDKTPKQRDKSKFLFKKRRKVMKFCRSGVITYKKPDWKISCVRQRTV